jgi:hypothetical protein
MAFQIGAFAGRGEAAPAGTALATNGAATPAAAAALTGAAGSSSSGSRGGRDVVWPGVRGMDRALMQMLHNILMMAAFALLLPMGMLLARHKWMFGRNPLTVRHGGVSLVCVCPSGLLATAHTLCHFQG